MQYAVYNTLQLKFGKPLKKIYFPTRISWNFTRPIKPEDLADDALLNSYRAGGDITVLGKLYERYMQLFYGCMPKVPARGGIIQRCGYGYILGTGYKSKTARY